MERAFQISAPNACISLIIPSSFIVTEGATGLRYLYMNGGSFSTIHDFTNQHRYFNIHSMFRFIIFTYQKGTSTSGIEDLKMGLKLLAETKQPSKKVSMTFPYLRSVSTNLLNVPHINSQKEKSLLTKLYKKHPVLGERLANRWNVKFVREVDMTNNSSSFLQLDSLTRDQNKLLCNSGQVTINGLKYSALFEGKMVHQFDYASKGYKGGQARTATWTSLSYGEKKILPHYCLDHSEFIKKHPQSSLPRAGFCDITGPKNERTVLAALIPGDVFCGNKVPTCRFDEDSPSLHLLWIAIANSFVVDWVIRRKISTTLNFFHWMQVPFPRISPKSEVGQFLSSLSGKLCILDDNQITYNNWVMNSVEKIDFNRDRDILRAIIDAIVAREYGLEVDEMATIFNDFPILDRGFTDTKSLKLSLTKMMVIIFLVKLENNIHFLDLQLDDQGLKEEKHLRMLQDVIDLRKFECFGYIPTEIYKSLKEK
jgi:hypothetical protein